MITSLHHGRVQLALHRLHAGSGTPVLLLHALGGSAADFAGAALAWAGPVYALDLSGHGASSGLVGGAYTPERWCADVDLALRELGDDVWVVGHGVSAYVALLVAGARPEAVHGAVLLPGRGLDGAGPEPSEPFPPRELAGVGFSESVLRPVARARACGEAARALVLGEDGELRPPWWCVLRGLPEVQLQRGVDASRALALLVDHAQPPTGKHSLRALRSA